MATDVAQLGIAVQSGGVVVASNRLDRMTRSGARAEGMTKRLTSSLISMKGALAGLGVGLIFGAITRNTIAQEDAMAQLEQAVRSTGGAAGFTAEELANMASELQNVTKFGDDAIMNMQGILLTFTQIGKETLPAASEAVLNVATRMGTDLKSAALQLGKALNDPISGLDGLNRAGVQFSDQQKDLIKRLAESGRMADAQRMILAELETQFGGSARAARQTFGGALEAVKNRIGDLIEDKDGFPGLTAALNGLDDGMRAIIEAGGDLEKDESFDNWAVNTSTAIALVADIARSAGFTISTGLDIIGKTLGAGSAQLVATLKGDLDEALRIGNEFWADMEEIMGGVEGFNSSAVRDRLATLRGDRESDSGSGGDGGGSPGSTDFALFDVDEYSGWIDSVIAEDERFMKEREALRREAEALTASVMTAEERYNAELERNTMLLSQGLMPQETFNRRLAEMNKELENSKRGFDIMEQAGIQAGRSLQQAFADFFMELDGDIKSMAKNFIDAVRSMIAQMLAFQAMQALFPAGTAMGNFFNTAASGSRASGGSVQAGKMYQVAEFRKPEYFIPETNGKMVPADKMGQSTNITINNDNRGAVSLAEVDRISRMRAAEAAAQVLGALTEGRPVSANAFA